MKKKTQNTTKKPPKKLVLQLKAFLPEALAKALENYRAVMDKVQPEDADEYKKLIEAQKTGLSHVLLLLDLARWVNENSTKRDKSLFTLIKKAQEEIFTVEGAGRA